MPVTSRPRVVVVGGGFAGMGALRALDGRERVTLIDRKPHFEFLPNIHEIVSGLKNPGTVRLAHERVARGLGHAFLQDEVRAIHPETRTVVTATQHVPYDALILTPGGGPAIAGIEGVPEHTHLFRGADDARAIHDRLTALLDLRVPVHVTIVGGGFSGVEVLGEILRRHRRKERLSLRVVESGPRLMGDWPKALDRRIRKIAGRHAVSIRLGTRVARVEADRITLQSGESLPSHMTLWTAGSKAPHFLESAGLPTGSSGWVTVGETLASTRFPDVFVAGDAAEPPRRVPKQGEEALKMGERAAKNARRLLAGRPLKPFRRDPLPLLVTFGDLSAFIVMEDDTVLEGEALAFGREVVFQESMAALDDLTDGRPAARTAKRLLRGERKLGWRGSLSPFKAFDQLAGLRVHRP
jgi:NADH dehydrogenase